ncbi:hypothetical protein [Streptomyces orinoci]|uniref:Uncharacterized protein n=1 Tax=Streptomyces orinoci TaxID=67339 RepID=A0ABV3K3W9_STRON|nr:hypothetical protein [Streptomyces orinoci]
MPPGHALTRNGGLLELTVDLRPGLFLALPVVVLVLICQAAPGAGPAGTLLALLPLLRSDRAFLRYRLLRAI